MRNDSEQSIYVDSLTHRVSRSFAIFFGGTTITIFILGNFIFMWGLRTTKGKDTKFL